MLGTLLKTWLHNGPHRISRYSNPRLPHIRRAVSITQRRLNSSISNNTADSGRSLSKINGNGSERRTPLPGQAPVPCGYWRPLRAALGVMHLPHSLRVHQFRTLRMLGNLDTGHPPTLVKRSRSSDRLFPLAIRFPLIRITSMFTASPNTTITLVRMATLMFIQSLTHLFSYQLPSLAW